MLSSDWRTYTILIARDGTERLIDDSAAPMRDEAGVLIGAVLVFRDVTERRHADEARARIAETLGLALAAADLGTWEWDPATDQITLSDRAAEIYGLQPGRTYLREWMRGLIRPDYRDRARKAAARAVADRADYDFEYPLDRPGEKERWVSARGRGVYDASGNLIRMLGVVQDITARKEAELALRESEARFRRLASAGIIGVIWWDLDRGLILDANDEFLRMTGYDRADMEAGRLDFRAMTPPEWTARNEAGIRELRETGVGGAYEKEYFRKDGSRVPVIIVGVRFEGATSEGMSFVLDITDRKRMEEELAASRDQLEIILRGVADGITVQDHAGRLLFANDGAARLTGFPSAEALLATPLPELMKRFDLCDESGKPFAPAEPPRPAGPGRGAEPRSRRQVPGHRHRGGALVARPGDAGTRPARRRQVRGEHLPRHHPSQAGRRDSAVPGGGRGGAGRVARLQDHARQRCPPLRPTPGRLVYAGRAGGGRVAQAAGGGPHRDPERVRWAHEIHGRYPPDPRGPARSAIR